MRKYYYFTKFTKCMTFNRRHFCSVLGMGATGIVGSTVSAQSEVQITGTVDSTVAADVEGVELFFQQVDTGSFWRYTVPASGEIDQMILETGEFRVRVDNTSARKEDVPLVYSFGRTTVDDTGATVSYTLPQSYDVKIQCVDGKGNPVEQLPIRFRAGGYSHGSGVLTTSEQGYVQFIETSNTKDQSELQLAGPTSVEVDATGDTANQPLGTIDVVEDAEFEFEISNPEQYQYNFKIIDPDPAAGFYHPYLLFIPDVNKTTERPLYVEPLNSLEATDRGQLDRQLVNSYQDKKFAGARRNGYPGIVAGFPRTPNDGPDYIQTLALPSYQSELFSDKYQLDEIAIDAFSAKSLRRVDEQLLAMISDAKSRLASEPYPIAEKIHMSGFSASNTFSNRFAFLYPNRVRTLTTGGSSVVPLPKASHNDVSLPYPLGTADYKDLTGREFDKDAWADINRYIYVGREDQPLPSTDNRGYYSGSGRYPNKAETVFGKNRVTERFPFVKSQYNSASDNATFEIFDGIGHSIDQRMEDAIVSFHRQNSPDNQITISNVEIDPSMVDATGIHTLTFDVKNLSADGGADSFTISLSEDVVVSDISIVDIDGLIETPPDPDPANQIEFSVNPSSGDITDSPLNFAVELKLSPTNT